jgi:hypothetical protein
MNLRTEYGIKIYLFRIRMNVLMFASSTLAKYLSEYPLSSIQLFIVISSRRDKHLFPIYFRSTIFTDEIDRYEARSFEFAL